MKLLFSIFISFAQIGLFTFGGGYAMLPMINRVIVTQKKWVNEEELLDFYTIAQCAPGVMAVNTAAFIGAKVKGKRGAVMAVLGVIMPSIAVITFIAGFMQTFGDNAVLQNAFKGIRIAACATITVSLFRLGIKAVTDIITGVIAVAAFLCVVFLNISPAIIAPAAGILGALYALLKCRKVSEK